MTNNAPVSSASSAFSARVRSIGLAAVLTGLSVGVVLTACSGSSTTTTTINDAGADSTDQTNDGSVFTSDSGSGDASVTVSQACADSAKARCKQNDTCSNGVSNKSHYGDEPTCETRVAAQCQRNLDAPSTGATPSSVDTCSATIASETCAQYLGNDPDDSCLPPAGALAAGAACGVSAQCASTYCAIPAHSTCGVCATVPKAGDSCAATGECGARGGLRCDADNTCVAEAASGAACGKDLPCGPDLSCVIPKGDTMGTCAAAIATVGGTCDPKRQTGASCDTDLGLYCNPTTTMCVAYTFATNGEPCGEVSDGFVACSVGTCIFPQVEVDAGDGGDAGTKASTTGTCLADALDGQACDINVGPACESPARCIIVGDTGTSGTCVLPDPSTCK